MSAAAKRCGVRVVAGDTKVVERGRCDGVYLSVTAIGSVRESLSPTRIQVGQRVLVSGPIGDHGIAVLLARGDLRLDAEVESDCGEVSSLVHALLDEGVRVACARDPTRGGLATALCELARTAKVDVELDVARIPVRPAVADACELLGLDPLYVACEGRVALFIDEDHAARALSVLRRFHPEAQAIGVVREGSGMVIARAPFGGERVLDLLSGEQLPRIC
jgi:hydrogenase expression/formation protein HypE